VAQKVRFVVIATKLEPTRVKLWYETAVRLW